MRTERILIGISTAMLVLPLAFAPPAGGTPPAFTNIPLFATATLPAGVTTAPRPNSSGDSEPAIAFGSDGAMAVGGLAWIPDGINLWSGTYGSTPSYFGAMDTNLDSRGNGQTTGGHDEDLEITAAGTLLIADLDAVVNPVGNNGRLGVNVTRCPRGATTPADCQIVFLDSAGADRQWITSAGRTAWVPYHDSVQSTLIRVKRSTDEGRTWTQVGSPIPGQGAATGDSTFNNDLGPIVADPSTGAVYEVYASGEQQTKAKSITRNNIYVSRSTDGGRSWTSTLVYHAPPFTQLSSVFPALAIDPGTHTLYTAWTDNTHGVMVSSSTDAGTSWSKPQLVSRATTTVMSWIAANNGKVDVVYYGTSAGSTDDPSAVWNAYDSQLSNGVWGVRRVSNTPNHVGAVCLLGAACRGNRELLDLFEVAEDPLTNKAAVIYTDTTLSTWIDANGTTRKLPEIVLAFER